MEYIGQNQGRQEETLNPTLKFRWLFLDCDGEDVPAPWE